jgi:hypothetical protein
LDAAFVKEGDACARMYLPVSSVDSNEMDEYTMNLRNRHEDNLKKPCLDAVVRMSSIMTDAEGTPLTRRILDA